MREEIEIQNAGVLEFIKNNECVKFGNSYDLCKHLEVTPTEMVNFEARGAYAYVYK
jgi:DNA-binding Xre family transcriptional regulator